MRSWLHGEWNREGHSEALSELNDTAVGDATLCSGCCLSSWSWDQNACHKNETWLSCLKVFCFVLNRGKIKLPWVKCSPGHRYTYCTKQILLVLLQTLLEVRLQEQAHRGAGRHRPLPPQQGTWGSAEAAAKGLLSAASRKIADVVLCYFFNWIPVYVFIGNWPDFSAHRLLQHQWFQGLSAQLGTHGSCLPGGVDGLAWEARRGQPGSQKPDRCKQPTNTQLKAKESRSLSMRCRRSSSALLLLNSHGSALKA